MSEQFQTVMIFRWKGELPSDDDEPDPERLTRLLSLGPSDSLLRSLQDLGYKTLDDAPSEAYDGWDIGIEIEGKKYTLYVHWWTPDNDKFDWFVIRTYEPRGCLAALLSRPVQYEHLMPVVAVVKQVVQGIGQMHEIHWITYERFIGYYACGKKFDI